MIWDTTKYKSTDLVKNTTLINSLLAKNPTWTESDARRKIDEAWTIMTECQKKKNIAIEQKTFKVEGEVCPECGSSKLIRTGVCKACVQCGQSLGCS